MKNPPRKFWLLVLLQACIIIAVLGWRFYAGRSYYLIRQAENEWHSMTWSFFGASFVFDSVVLLFVMTFFIGIEYIVWCIAFSNRKEHEPPA